MSTLLVITAAVSMLGSTLLTLHFLLLVFTPIPPDTQASERTFTTTPSSTPSLLPSIHDDPSIALSVVVPAYNEDDRLDIMLDDAAEYFLKSSKESMRKEGVEVLVIDDGSSDGTTRTAQELARKSAGLAKGFDIRVVRLERNRGKGGAVQHGVMHSRGKLILFADADGATRFSDLDLLLKGMEDVQDSEGYGMVIGSRAHLVNSDAVVKRSKLRNLLMHGFHIFLRTLGVKGIKDTQCGFKLFTRKTAQLLFPPLHLPRWSFDVELLLLASLIVPTIPVREVAVAWHEVNGSKIRLGWDSLGMARDLLVLRGNLAMGKWTVPERPRMPNGINGLQVGEQKG